MNPHTIQQAFHFYIALLVMGVCAIGLGTTVAVAVSLLLESRRTQNRHEPHFSWRS